MAYEWAGDPQTRNLAFIRAKNADKGATEADVKKIYIELGGTLVGEEAQIEESVTEKPKKKKK